MVKENITKWKIGYGHIGTLLLVPSPQKVKIYYNIKTVFKYKPLQIRN